MQRAVKDGGKIVGEAVLKTVDGDQIMSTDDVMKVQSGSITTDETSEIPGDAKLKLIIDRDGVADVMPMGPRSPLSPVANNMLYLRYRAEDDDEYTAYGVYDIAETEANETDDGISLDLDVYDPSRRVKRFGFYRPYSYPANYPYDEVWVSLLQSVLPFSDIEIVPTGDKVITLSWDIGDSRLRAANDLALMVGYRIEWNQDGIGNTLIGPDTPIGADPIWSFEHGGNAKITRANRRLSDEEAYNGVLVKAQNAASDGPPIYATAWDLDPNSPTYFDPTDPNKSSYGANPYIHDSPFAHTKAQCLAIARSLLPKKMGLVERLTIECVLNPGVSLADPIYVKADNLGVAGVFIVESTTLPINSDGGLMQIGCRERRLFA
jgi:hypothetical protein